MSGELVRRDDPDLMTLGDILVRSRFFRDSQDHAQAVVKVLAGREYGLGPIASMTGIHVVEGKPALSAHVMAMGIKRSGRYDYRVIEHTSERCTISFRERVDGKWEEIGRTTYTVEDAARADLARKSNHQRYPRAMLFARALSEGYRTHCPDALGACGPTYVEGEIETASQQQEPVTVQATVVEQSVDHAPPAQAADDIPESPRDAYRDRRRAIRDRLEDLTEPGVALSEKDRSTLAYLGEYLQVMEPRRLAKAEEWLSGVEQEIKVAAGLQPAATGPAATPPLSEAETSEEFASEVGEAIQRAKQDDEQAALKRAEQTARAMLEAAKMGPSDAAELDALDPGKRPKAARQRRGKRVTPEAVAEEVSRLARLEGLTGEGQADW